MKSGHEISRPALALTDGVVAWFIILAGPGEGICGRPEPASQWRGLVVAIDGQDTEWQESWRYLPDARLSLAVRNDHEYLYIALMTGSRDVQMQMMMRGFTLWIDHKGGKKKRLGIRFPLGMKNGDAMPPRGEGFGPERIVEHFEASATAMEVLGHGEDEHLWAKLGTIRGLDVAAGLSEDLFVYELKVPLQESATHPIAIGTEPGAEIGVGLETRKPDRGSMQWPQGGGMRGGGGGMRGGGGRSGGHRPEMPRPLKVWTKVKLASAEDFEDERGAGQGLADDQASIFDAVHALLPGHGEGAGVRGRRRVLDRGFGLLSEDGYSIPSQAKCFSVT